MKTRRTWCGCVTNIKVDAHVATLAHRPSGHREAVITRGRPWWPKTHIINPHLAATTKWDKSYQNKTMDLKAL